MSKYQCLTCTKNFKQKSQLEYHKNRKNKCKSIIEGSLINTIETSNNVKNTKIDKITPSNNVKNPKIDEIIPPNNVILTEILPNPTQDNKLTNNEPIPIQNKVLADSFPCEHCKKSFTRKDIVTNHIKKSCPVIKQRNKEKQVIVEKLLLLEMKYKELEEKIKNKDDIIKDKDTLLKDKDTLLKTKDDIIKNKETHYEETIKKLTSENKILQTVTINNNNNSNNTININFVSHGNENLLERQIGELMLMVAARRGVNIVEELISLVHFNPTFPEFQNIYLPDMKNNHMMVYDNEWILKNATIAIKELCDNKSSFIIDNINAIFNRLTIPTNKII